MNESNLRLDDLENGYMIWQDPKMFCFGVDAVLLAHFPALKKGDRILDLGTGFAPVPLIMKAEANRRGIPVSITGLEIQKRAADIARRSVEYNGLTEDISIVQGDIREAAQQFRAASFSLVVSNPPYMAVKDGLVGEDEAKATARTELKCTLHDVLSAAGYLLGSGGRFAMIHRPFRLPEIFAEMQAAKLEPKRLQMVHPYADAEPSMVLVEGVKCGRPYLKTAPPLIISDRDGSYTKELLALYGKA